MQILELRLHTSRLAAQRAFYAAVLELPLVADGPASFAVQAGATRLVFDAIDDDVALYHLAFNIPRHTLAQAKEWLRGRAELLYEDGQDEFTFPSWQAQAVYFRDAAGNLLEVIARQTLANDADGGFGPRSLLCVSEIGVPVENVAATVAALQARLGIAPYMEQGGTFAPLGDEHGLILVVAVGRPWNLIHSAARAVPVSVTIQGAQGERISLPHLPEGLL